MFCLCLAQAYTYLLRPTQDTAVESKDIVNF